MEKLLVKPIFSASMRRMRAKMEWKVPIHTLRASLALTSCMMRSFISRAALLVKVSAMMLKGSTPS